MEQNEKRSYYVLAFGAVLIVIFNLGWYVFNLPWSLSLETFIFTVGLAAMVYAAKSLFEEIQRQ